VFTDVPDGASYAQSAERAKTRGVSRGTNSAGTLFSPGLAFTRAQAVAFFKRYNDYVVQPELDNRYTKFQTDLRIPAVGVPCPACRS